MDTEITVPASLLRRIKEWIEEIKMADDFGLDAEGVGTRLLDEIEEVLNRE